MSVFFHDHRSNNVHALYVYLSIVLRIDTFDQGCILMKAIMNKSVPFINKSIVISLYHGVCNMSLTRTSFLVLLSAITHLCFV